MAEIIGCGFHYGAQLKSALPFSHANQRGHPVDILSIILTALGWQRDRTSKVDDRRIEAYRLNAEVAADTAQCIGLLRMATPDLLRRAQLLFPNQPEAVRSCHDTLTTLCSQAEQLHEMAEGYKAKIEGASNWIDWDRVVRKQHEWRATASTLRPHIEAIIKKYEDLLSSAETTSHVAEPNTPPPPKDRGWDAPPL